MLQLHIGTFQIFGSLGQFDRSLRYLALQVGVLICALARTLLVRVVDREPAYSDTPFANLTQAALVRCEVGIIAGENVSALAGLGVSHALQDSVKLAHDLVSVYNPLAVFGIARQTPIGEAGDEKQQRRRSGYATDELALESQSTPKRFCAR